MVACSKCGWGHYAVTRKEAEKQVKEFNRIYEKTPKEERMKYWKSPSSISLYEYCFNCGAHYKEVNLPFEKEGAFTVQPIIQSEE
jgi:Zn ribbon nucleic-acid-binding protein